MVDDCSSFTWTMFMKSKKETFPVFATFAKHMYMKYSEKISGIRFDHGTEFKNVKFNEFCNELGIDYNFYAPRNLNKMMLQRGK